MMTELRPLAGVALAGLKLVGPACSAVLVTAAVLVLLAGEAVEAQRPAVETLKALIGQDFPPTSG